MKKGSYLKKVRNQYEDYPYPARDPLSEKERLLEVRPNFLACINHHCFEGKEDFQSNFRVLVAGGGTGDCTIFLAEQLKQTNAEIVYLDMSKASMKVAQERAKIRNLENITWVHDSILNIPNLDLGSFDYITCTGVLHHLSEPNDGLSALKSVLKETGSMYIMVYGTYGRIPIYQLQDLMRRVNQSTKPIEDKISNTKKILQALPKSNWFQFNKGTYIYDLDSDIGIYDLLLHSQDRSYTIPEFYEFFEQQGLVLNNLFEDNHPLGLMLFEPETYIQDPDILKQVKALPLKEQHAICELIYGQMIKQSAYVSHHTKKPASFDNLQAIPTISGIYNKRERIAGLLEKFKEGTPIIQLNDFIGLKRSKYTSDLFEKLCENKQGTIEDIVNSVVDMHPKSSQSEISKEFKALLETLYKGSFVYLKSSPLIEYRSLDDMQITGH